jgi:sulfur transfer complex TusBCD TusB component (DsrH family)
MNFTTDIALPISKVNLELKAALIANGVVHATLRNLPCSLIKDSLYHFENDLFPNNYRGSLVFYTGTITTNNLIEVAVHGTHPISGQGNQSSTGSTEVLP